MINMEIRQIELGDKVRDKITGYEGITTIKSIFLNGCVQFTVARKLKVGEDYKEANYGVSIDEQSLEIIKKDALNLHPKPKPIKERTGGPTRPGFRMRGY